MELFSDLAGWELIARWAHFLAGITWIGLLYYFNFVQAPFMAGAEAGTRSEATRKLVPRALWWFRYAALYTWVAGIVLILMYIAAEDWRWGDVLTRPFPQGLPLLTGMTLGTIMFLNVWGAIWPNQKIVIGSAEATAGGGSADPRATGAARRGLLASRTNVVFSIPMLFFMATSAHLPLAQEASTGQKVLYVLLAGIVIAAVEANALVGDKGTTKQPLEKIGTTIASGFALWVVLYVLIQVTLG